MNAWEKFHGATLSLVRTGTIKDRLNDAYRNYLAHVDETELPKEIRDEFRAFSCSLHRERPLLRGEDAVRATIRKMSSDEADEVASSVVRMYGVISRGMVPSAQRSPSGAQVIPLYLAE